MLTSAPDYNTYSPSHPFFDYTYRSQIAERRLQHLLESSLETEWTEAAKYGKGQDRNYIIEITFEF